MEEVTAGVYLVSISQSRYSAVYGGGHAKTVFLHAAISSAAHQTCEMLMNAQFRFCRDERSCHNIFPKFLLSQSRCFAINWYIILYNLENLILIKNKSFQNNFCTIAYSQPRIWVSTHFHKSRGGSLRAANAGSTATSSHGPDHCMWPCMWQLIMRTCAATHSTHTRLCMQQMHLEVHLLCRVDLPRYLGTDLVLKINASKFTRGVLVKNTSGLAPSRAFLGSTWSYSMSRTWGRNPIAKKLRSGRMVGHTK
jgi:hypothetical protein